MNRLFVFVFSMSFITFGYSYTIEELQERTLHFFKEVTAGEHDIVEIRNYILQLREDVIDAGYNPPTIEEALEEIKKIEGFEVVSDKLKAVFFGPSESHTEVIIGYTYNGVPIRATPYACTKKEMDALIAEKTARLSEDGFDWGPACAGGALMLAGSLCCIIPTPATLKIGEFLLTLGAGFVFGNVAKRSEFNMEKDKMKEQKSYEY